MKTSQMMTAGSIAFAAFALWYVMKKQGGGAIATQAGQQQRDAGLAAFSLATAYQWADLQNQYVAETFAETKQIFRPSMGY